MAAMVCVGANARDRRCLPLQPGIVFLQERDQLAHSSRSQECIEPGRVVADEAGDGQHALCPARKPNGISSESLPINIHMFI